MRTPTSQGGFTLVELITVVAIIGILATLAVPGLKRKPDVAGAAQRVASTFAEGGRLAVQRGAIPDGAAPVRIEVDGNASRVVVWKRGTAASDEAYTDYLNLPSTIEIYGYSMSAQVGATLTGVVPLGTSSISIYCNSMGRCDALTLLLRERSSPQTYFRVVQLPLAASADVVKARAPDWRL